MVSKPKPQEDIHLSTVAAIVAITFGVTGVIFLVCYLVGLGAETPKHYWKCADGYSAKYTCEAYLTERPLSDRVDNLEQYQAIDKSRFETLERDDEVVKKKLKLPTPTPVETSTAWDVWAKVCAPDGNCYYTGVR